MWKWPNDFPPQLRLRIDGKIFVGEESLFLRHEPFFERDAMREFGGANGGKIGGVAFAVIVFHACPNRFGIGEHGGVDGVVLDLIAFVFDADIGP